LPDQTNVFEASTDSATPSQTAPIQTDPFADQLAKITKEDGTQKYDTLDKALDGLANAQNYIPQLKGTVTQQEQEIASLKAQLEQRQSVEDVVARLQQQAPTQEPQATPQAPAQQVDVAEQVRQILQQERQQSVAQQNTEQVNNALNSMYGENASKAVTERAAALGTTVGQLQTLAGQNPDMVMALFNQAPTQTNFKPTSGSITIPPTAPQERAPLERPEKSLLSGAKAADQKAYILKIKEDVHAKFGVTG
jgi:hypothetical protein